MIGVAIATTKTMIVFDNTDDAIYLGDIYSSNYPVECDENSITITGKFTREYWTIILEKVFPNEKITFITREMKEKLIPA